LIQARAAFARAHAAEHSAATRAAAADDAADDEAERAAWMELNLERERIERELDSMSPVATSLERSLRW